MQSMLRWQILVLSSLRNARAAELVDIHVDLFSKAYHCVSET